MNMRAACIVCAALLVSTPVSVADQDSASTRAIRILDEIIRVLNAILERQESRARPQAIQLFNGRDLSGWKVTEFAGAGPVRVEPNYRGDGPAILVEPGATLSGITVSRDVPRDRYEVALEFMKIEGSDFACGLTFPVGESHATLVLGGWGGSVVGLSCIDGHDASENETTAYRSFAENQWYSVRLRVALPMIEAWLDGQKLCTVDTTDHKISLRHGEIWRSAPLGVATYQTKAAFRKITLTPLPQSGGR